MIEALYYWLTYGVYLGFALYMPFLTVYTLAAWFICSAIPRPDRDSVHLFFHSTTQVEPYDICFEYKHYILGGKVPLGYGWFVGLMSILSFVLGVVILKYAQMTDITMLLVLHELTIPTTAFLGPLLLYVGGLWLLHTLIRKSYKSIKYIVSRTHDVIEASKKEEN